MRRIKLRSSSHPLPRLEKRTLFPRVTKEARKKIEEAYEKAVQDFKRHYREAAQTLLDPHEMPEGPPFPYGVPELRVEESILGSKQMAGVSMAEPSNGIRNVITIGAETALLSDPYLTCAHELFHSWGSQHALAEDDPTYEINEAEAEMLSKRLAELSLFGR